MQRKLVLAGLFLLAAATGARAEYPDKPVKIVVPVAAGGGVDVMARLLAQHLGERLHQQFVVENRPGAAGVIGSKSVIASPACMMMPRSCQVWPSSRETIAPM